MTNKMNKSKNNTKKISQKRTKKYVKIKRTQILGTTFITLNAYL